MEINGVNLWIYKQKEKYTLFVNDTPVTTMITDEAKFLSVKCGIEIVNK